MNQLISKTLSEIVNDKYQTASVFEKYHLDYCCKGKRSLQQACEEANVPVNKIVEELQNSFSAETDSIDFNRLKLYELVEYIVHTHHSYVKKEMPQIISYLQKVASKHGSKHAELFKISELFDELSDEMIIHMHKEEVIVFPQIIQSEQIGFHPLTLDTHISGYLKMPVTILENEHESAGNIMEEIRKLSNNFISPADSCTTFKLLYASLKAFEIDLHQHVHLENSILFPKALMQEKELRMSTHN